MGYFLDYYEGIGLDDDPLLPAEARVELPLYGFPSYAGNDGHPTDNFSSFEPERVGANVEALYYALRAQRLEAHEDPAEAHEHNDPNTVLDYLPLVSLRCGSGLGGTHIPADRRNGLLYVNFATARDVTWIPFVVPVGFSVPFYVFPRARVNVPSVVSPGATGKLHVRFDFWQATSSASPNLITACGESQVIVVNGTSSNVYDGEWVEGAPALLEVPTAVNGCQLVYLQLSTFVQSGDADLLEVELGLRYGR